MSKVKTILSSIHEIQAETRGAGGSTLLVRKAEMLPHEANFDVTEHAGCFYVSIANRRDNNLSGFGHNSSSMRNGGSSHGLTISASDLRELGQNMIDMAVGR